MSAARRSPLIRIALLALAVLLAHTAHVANAEPIVPVSAPCPGKVAAAQPNPEKKLTLVSRKMLRPGRPLHSGGAGGGFGLAEMQAAGLSAVRTAARCGTARCGLFIAPQRRTFALRI